MRRRGFGRAFLFSPYPTLWFLSTNARMSRKMDSSFLAISRLSPKPLDSYY
jgi:hypothetical protein